MSDDGRRARKVRHPILRLEVLGPDGRRTSEHRVFCRLQGRSVAVGTCCSCVHCDEITLLPSPSVACTVVLDDEQLGPDPRGQRTPIGNVLETGTLVVRPGTTLRDALGELRSANRRSIAVVDDALTVVGVVHEATFARHPRGSRLRGTGDVVRAMSAVLALHERVPVRRALELLAAAHAREATVVDDRGVPIGVFRDVDGLLWISQAERGSR